MHVLAVSLSLIVASVMIGCAAPPPLQPLAASPLQPAGDERVTLDHLLVIVDASESVHDAAMFEVQQDLVRAYVASIPDGDYEAGAIAFGGKTRQYVPLERFDRARFDASVSEIQHLERGTPLYKVLEEASVHLIERNGRAAVVIFSDGLVTDEFGHAVEPARTVRAARELELGYAGTLCIHAVQIGGSKDGGRDLRAIAETTDCGSYRAASGTSGEPELHAFHREVFLAEARGNAPLEVDAPVTPTALAPRRWLIQFDVGSSELDERYRRQVTEIASELGRDPSARVRITGHTDSVGDLTYNQRLSLRRAEAARAALIQSGVSSDRVEVKGYGFEKPLMPNDSDDNRSANRRTEVELVRDGQQ